MFVKDSVPSAHIPQARRHPAAVATIFATNGAAIDPIGCASRAAAGSEFDYAFTGVPHCSRWTIGGDILDGLADGNICSDASGRSAFVGGAPIDASSGAVGNVFSNTISDTTSDISCASYSSYDIVLSNVFDTAAGGDSSLYWTGGVPASSGNRDLQPSIQVSIADGVTFCKSFRGTWMYSPGQPRTSLSADTEPGGDCSGWAVCKHVRFCRAASVASAGAAHDQLHDAAPGFAVSAALLDMHYGAHSPRCHATGPSPG